MPSRSTQVNATAVSRGERFLSQFESEVERRPHLSGVSAVGHPRHPSSSSGYEAHSRTTALTASSTEAWLPLRVMAAQLGCSPRWLEYRVCEGMPTAIIAGRRKCRPSEVERWLERHGHMRREGSR